jgi:hypothetical protein
MIWLLLALALTSCAGFIVPDTSATLQAENNRYIAEATAIRETAAADEARIAATAQAVETAAMRINAVNRELLSTVRAVVPPTQAIVSVAATQGVASSLSGQRRLLNTGTSVGVRDSDGCITSPQIQFPVETERIYATVRAFNVEAGVPVNVEWIYEGEVVFNEALTLEQGSAEICLWFYIDPTIVPFSPGSWSVTLFAEGAGQEVIPMTFTIGDAMMMDDT